MNAVVDLASRRRAVAEPPAPVAVVLAADDRVLRLREVTRRVGLHTATIYRRIAAGEFPAQVSLGGNSVGWRNSEVNAWIANRGPKA